MFLVIMNKVINVINGPTIWRMLDLGQLLHEKYTGNM